LKAQLLHGQLELGAEDEPTRRQSQRLFSEKLRRFADELRARWHALTPPPRQRHREPCADAREARAA